MVVSGLYLRNKKPFENVYFTGIVRDNKGRKMSKQLGNSPDPIKLIEKYGADSVRMGLLFSAPAENDLLFDDHCVFREEILQIKYGMLSDYLKVLKFLTN